MPSMKNELISLAVVGAITAAGVVGLVQWRGHLEYSRGMDIFSQENVEPSRDSLRYWGSAGNAIILDMAAAGPQFAAGMLEAEGATSSVYFIARDERNPAPFDAGLDYQTRHRLTLAEIEQVADRVASISEGMLDLRQELESRFKKKGKNHDREPGRQTAGLIFLHAVVEALGPDAEIHPSLENSLGAWRTEDLSINPRISLFVRRDFGDIDTAYHARMRAVVDAHLMPNPIMREAVAAALRLDAPIANRKSMSRMMSAAESSTTSQMEHDLADAGLHPYAGADPFTDAAVDAYVEDQLRP